ncbi:hypothetical protein IMY05_C4540000900 [Salix suchowensis]|nr:hypothetical protein IMY05_C4540000900 [Salix suchowensis]
MLSHETLFLLSLAAMYTLGGRGANTEATGLGMERWYVVSTVRTTIDNIRGVGDVLVPDGWFRSARATKARRDNREISGGPSSPSSDAAVDPPEPIDSFSHRLPSQSRRSHLPPYSEPASRQDLRPSPKAMATRSKSSSPPSGLSQLAPGGQLVLLSTSKVFPILGETPRTNNFCGSSQCKIIDSGRPTSDLPTEFIRGMGDRNFPSVAYPPGCSELTPSLVSTQPSFRLELYVLADVKRGNTTRFYNPKVYGSSERCHSQSFLVSSQTFRTPVPMLNARLSSALWHHRGG